MLTQFITQNNLNENDCLTLLQEAGLISDLVAKADDVFEQKLTVGRLRLEMDNLQINNTTKRTKNERVKD